MKRHQKNLPIRIVTFEHNGKTYSGNYTVDGQYLKVSFGMEAKTTLIDPFAGKTETLAALLLSELVSEKKRDS